MTTLEKFGYPKYLVKEYDHWILFYRYKHITLGSLILCCKDEASRFSDISNEAFVEFPTTIKEIESKLSALFHYDKINYLMLMMVDPEVHFHVIPRYAAVKNFGGHDFHDYSWPKAVDITKINEISTEIESMLIETLRNAFKG